MEQKITGTTKMLGLIGTPVGHSGSPAMYNYSFQKLGIDCAYLAFDIPIEKVEEAIAAAKTFHMQGFNVTMPCKTEVAKHVDELSPAAKLIGAVNTVVMKDGKLYGNNTDGIGFVNNMAKNGVDIAGKRMTVMGAGGAATAIQVQCALDGASQISIFNRKDEFFANGEKTVQKIKETIPNCIINIYDLADEKKLYEEIAQSDILVNATKVGMKPLEDQSLITNTKAFRSDLIVADAVYNPKETKFVLSAKEHGCKIAIGGIGMLLWQGAAAFHLFTGKDMPADEVYEKFFK